MSGALQDRLGVLEEFRGPATLDNERLEVLDEDCRHDLNFSVSIEKKKLNLSMVP